MKFGTRDVRCPMTGKGLIVVPVGQQVIGGRTDSGRTPASPDGAWQIEDLIAPLAKMLQDGQALWVEVPDHVVDAVRATIDRMAHDAQTAVDREKARRLGTLDAVRAIVTADSDDRTPPR